MDLRLFLIGAVLGVLIPVNAIPADDVDGEKSGCSACHKGLEPIRDPASEMMKQIRKVSATMGDPEGCVLCHGGDPAADTEEEAHTGKFFYADPGSPWVNESVCGPCHPDHCRAQWHSPMMTESGKIQGTSWSFGCMQEYNHGWGNYDAKNPDDPTMRIGTGEYRAYMERLALKQPGAFPSEQTTLPEAPRDLSQLAEHPELAAFTYHRTECQRCHLGVKGRNKRGDFRGMGCSACHIPYGNEGLYEGADPTIPKDEPGHHLVHSIQASREAKVAVHGTEYSGVPVETCTTCHDRGKRIGVSFQGLMESPFESPYQPTGEGQVALHTKHYIAMHEDIHSKKGMMCLDCHTSIDVHGDGFIAGTNLAQVQIECYDCHGTPGAYPWELPIGYGDEFDLPLADAPRGVARDLLPHHAQGTVHPPEDGYLRTARGNPFPEVVRRGNKVIVHAAGGKDIELSPLKLMVVEGQLETEPRVAMVSVSKHIDRMECYACHAVWVPQCYGCHLLIDYSGGKKAFDWVAAGHQHQDDPASRADRGEEGFDTYVPGKVSEQRSYMRWEEPPLAVSGEGRICTVTTGCQPNITIIGENGETILHNHVFRTKPGLEGSGPEGQLCIDMSPGQPHTTGRARACESCHNSPKALGHGIGGGQYTRPWDKDIYVDLMTAGGDILPESTRVQTEGIPGLQGDWSQYVTEDGKQIQTVGHHFLGSRPLNDAERANTDRRGLCLACHQEIPTESLAVSLLHHVAEYADALPRTNEQHSALVNKILLFSAWGQAGGAVGLPLAVLAGAGLWVRHRRRKAAVSASELAAEALEQPPGPDSTESPEDEKPA